MTVRLSGVLPPIPTPFDAHGNVELGKLTENLGRWNAYDLDGYMQVVERFIHNHFSRLG